MSRSKNTHVWNMFPYSWLKLPSFLLKRTSGTPRLLCSPPRPRAVKMKFSTSTVWFLASNIPILPTMGMKLVQTTSKLQTHGILPIRKGIQTMAHILNHDLWNYLKCLEDPQKPNSTLRHPFAFLFLFAFFPSLIGSMFPMFPKQIRQLLRTPGFVTKTIVILPPAVAFVGHLGGSCASWANKRCHDRV